MKYAATKKIFISYRVHDTAGETGRLVDALKQYFSDDQIFMDIENLEPGADFTEAIEKSLDTCDVFLSIIGPHWLGDRDGQNIRINDPNDWVRLEVSTALQRNIRVVPVLVDGATLPKQEQLPQDLQPLLRRQAIEISNKRWRYDTDQLIRFLVQTVGITPKKATQGGQPSATQQKPRKTWVYIGAGFGLAILVLVILGSVLQQEEGTNKTPSEKEPAAVEESVLPTDQGTTTNPATSPNKPVSNNQSTTAINVSGTWDEVDEGETSTFLLQQQGDFLTVQITMTGQVISTGTGEINNRQITMNFPLFGMPTVVSAVLSDDGNTISGHYTIQANNTTQPIKLVRRTK
jgi:hypothetical protein